MRTIMHVDLDAFFCAVEQRRNPTLAGKAFVVAGRSDERGVVATASYAARAYGIKAGTPTARAQQLCRDIIVVRPRYPDYGAAAAEVMQVLQAETALVEQASIDEAYVDFAEYSALPLVKEFDNVIVLRTLSKGYSLAGLRLGFGIANPSLLSGLFKVKDSYNIDAVAIALGTAAISDQDYKNANDEKVKISRTKLTQDLQNLGFAVLESHGNFVLAKTPKGNAEEIYLQLKETGILVRYFNQTGLADKLRITVGTDEQNQALINFLSTF